MNNTHYKPRRGGGRTFRPKIASEPQKAFAVVPTLDDLIAKNSANAVKLPLADSLFYLLKPQLKQGLHLPDLDKWCDLGYKLKIQATINGVTADIQFPDGSRGQIKNGGFTPN